MIFRRVSKRKEHCHCCYSKLRFLSIFVILLPKKKERGGEKRKKSEALSALFSSFLSAVGNSTRGSTTHHPYLSSLVGTRVSA